MELLEEKKELLLQILDFTQRQKDALDKDEDERFERLVRRRKEVIDKWQSLEERHPELRQEKYAEILAKIKMLDDENIAVFKVKMENVRIKLKQIRESKRTENPYSHPYQTAVSSGYHFDQK